MIFKFGEIYLFFFSYKCVQKSLSEQFLVLLLLEWKLYFNLSEFYG